MSFCHHSFRVTPDGILHVRRTLVANGPLAWDQDGLSQIQIGRPPTDRSGDLFRIVTTDAAAGNEGSAVIDAFGRLRLGSPGASSDDAALALRVRDALAPPSTRPLALRVTTDTYADAVTIDWRGRVTAAGGVSSFQGTVELFSQEGAAIYRLAVGEVVQVTLRCDRGTYATARVLWPRRGEDLAIFEEAWRTPSTAALRLQSGPDGELRVAADPPSDGVRQVDWSVLVLLAGELPPGSKYTPAPPATPIALSTALGAASVTTDCG